MRVHASKALALEGENKPLAAACERNSKLYSIHFVLVRLHKMP